MGSAQLQSTNRTLKRLDATEVAAYQRDGFCFPLRVMSESDAAGFRGKLEAYEAAHQPIMQTALRNKPHLVFTWINELIRDARILDAVEDILGPNILAWGTNFFIKDPRDDAFTGHIDILDGLDCSHEKREDGRRVTTPAALNQ